VAIHLHIWLFKSSKAPICDDGEQDQESHDIWNKREVVIALVAKRLNLHCYFHLSSLLTHSCSLRPPLTDTATFNLLYIKLFGLTVFIRGLILRR
jgi:hypothetical protein